MNEQVLKGKWKDIKGEIQKTWGKLTGDEIEKTKGDMTSMSGLLQQKYGLAKDEANKHLSRIYDSYDNTKEAVKKNMREDINNKTERK
jgi:uncharacterized protein YjbJ (UPF0337 family)